MNGKKGEVISGLEETPQEKVLDVFLFLLFLGLIVVLVFYVLYLMHSEPTSFEFISFW